MGKLAITGGDPVVKQSDFFKNWPPYREAELTQVKESLQSSEHGWGKNCSKLQEEWSKWNGNKFVLATNSGTAALHMCLVACGIKAGDEVLVPSITWISSATAVLACNAIPVFVDIDYNTMLIDPNEIRKKITTRTKAIVAVHYWGLSCAMSCLL